MGRRKPRCIELFAGAGGLMLGLEMAGIKTIVANEVHADPCKTLKANFKRTPLIQGSIKDLNGKKLLDSAGYDEDVDIVAGGPPCQGFSTAGLKEKKDPRNSLIFDFLRIVDEVQPRFFILENVTGLRTMHGGKLFDAVCEQIAKIGYSFSHEVMTASEFGVPQMRRRIIVVGSRDGERFEFPLPTHSRRNETKSLFSELSPFVTCWEAISDLPMIGPAQIATEYGCGPQNEYQEQMRLGSDGVLHNHQTSNHRKETMDYYSLVPPGGTALDIPIEHRKAKQGIQRWPMNGISRTITTEPTDFLHPKLDRVPTVRETARIQSFPDHYAFMGQRTTGNKMRRLGYCSQTQQVGNAVPPLLAKAIGEAIKKQMFSKRVSAV